MRQALNAAKLFLVDRQLAADLGVTGYVASWIRRHGWEPTFLFRNVTIGGEKRRSVLPVVMNLFTERALLTRLALPDTSDAAGRLARRLESPESGTLVTGPLLASVECALTDLPVLRHQPREAGPYLTSFVAALRDPDNGTVNLGYYRALVDGPYRLVLFLDQRTDGWSIVERCRQRGEETPISLFNGGHPATSLAAAAALPPGLDSHGAAARLSGETLTLADFGDGHPPVPADAEIVILGRITADNGREAPFGEFKGYYAAPTSSPVVRVETVLRRPDAHYLGLFCGKESGLTLMKLQNEILMSAALARQGFPVGRVRFPLDAFGEFSVLIESERPNPALLEAAMAANRRAKLFIVARNLEQAHRTLSIFSFHARTEPYTKRGKQEGQRIGILAEDDRHHDWVEY
ncbi:UbiD family decarboxylase [Azospirillum sp. B506]|uniref:UbiD family decarboxylase n=1 Tax=Azospirillum sp. B506 TaxID=137721 RepID=UPI000349EB3A|nr:UbiD family decarboxylase [Azospirillum sp. B506]